MNAFPVVGEAAWGYGKGGGGQKEVSVKDGVWRRRRKRWRMTTIRGKNRKNNRARRNCRKERR